MLALVDGARRDPARTYFLGTTLRDYHRGGVDRDDPPGTKMRELQDELVKIGQQLDQNIAGDVRKFQWAPPILTGSGRFKTFACSDASGKITPLSITRIIFALIDYANQEPARKRFLCALPAARNPKTSMCLASSCKSVTNSQTFWDTQTGPPTSRKTRWSGQNRMPPTSLKKYPRRRRPVQKSITTNCWPTKSTKIRRRRASTRGTWPTWAGSEN